MEIKWQEIELSKLVGAPWNYKKDFEYLEEKLINNIKKNGIIENIIVREISRVISLKWSMVITVSRPARK